MFRLLAGFSAGVAAYKLYDLYPQIFQSFKDYENHPFKVQMQEIQYEQPQLIELIHKSDQMHFLYNFIIQNEKKVVNYLKVYFPTEMEKIVLSGKLHEMTDEEKIQKIKAHLVFNASEHVQGHSGVVHGGLLATLFDNGFVYLSNASTGLKPTATAYLNITYKKPIKINEFYIVSCSLEKINGKKIYMKGEVKDVDGKLYCEAQSLFVQVPWGTSAATKFVKLD